MKKIMLPIMMLGILYTSLFAETTEEEAARRMPPVLYTLDMPEIMVSNQPVTLRWSILGYHNSYKSSIAFYDCTDTVSCGANVDTLIKSSGKLNHSDSKVVGTSYADVYAKLSQYEYTFIPNTVDRPTKIVTRIYRINDLDEELGKGMPSLLMPGNISNTYYATMGRRVVKYIIPSLSNIGQLFPVTQILNSSDGTSENDFTYTGQCTWYVFQRLIELNDAHFFESEAWTKLYNSIHGKSGRDAKKWIENWMLGKNYEVSNIPKIGSIVVWVPNDDNINNDLYRYGHVAFVEKVDTQGKTFTVTQFNVHGNEQYSRATYSYSDTGDKLYSLRYKEPVFINLEYIIPTQPDLWEPTSYQ